MMRKNIMSVIIGLFLIIISSRSLAQGSDFKYFNSLKEAQHMAASSNKLLLIDFYTDWCVPCKVMDKEVFTNQDVQEYLDSKFVLTKLNAEKGEGVELAKKYKIRSYPNFIIAMSDGTEIFRIEGALNASLFVETLSKNLDDNRSDSRLEQRYNSGERNPLLINDYALSLMKKGEEGKGYEVVDSYFNSLRQNEKINPANWYVFDRYTSDIMHPRIIELIANQDEYRKSVGVNTVNDYLSRIFRVQIVPNVIGNVAISKEEWKRKLLFAKQANIDTVKQIDALIEIGHNTVAYGKGLQPLLAMERRFKDLNPNLRLVFMYNFKARKEGADAFNINVIQESLIEKNIAEQSDYNQKMLKRILGDLKKEIYDNGIQFDTLDFSKALSQASQLGKNIFIDFYTDWCGPCKELDHLVFSQNIVGAYFNKHFVNLKINAEKGQGVDLAKKYQVRSYPTLVYVNADGEEIFRIVGYLSAEALLNKTQKAMSGKGLGDLYKAYNNVKDRTPEVINSLVNTLYEAGLDNKANQILDSLFSSLKEKDKYSDKYSFVYCYAESFDSPRMQFFINNNSQFNKKLGQDKVTEIVDFVVPDILMNYQYEFRNRGFIDSKFPFIKTFNLPAESKAKLLSEIIDYAGQTNYEGILDILDKLADRLDGKNRLFASHLALAVPLRGTPEQRVKLNTILERIIVDEKDSALVKSYTMFRDRVQQGLRKDGIL